MNKPTGPDPRDPRRKLLWLIGLRVAIATLLFGGAVLVQLNAPGALPIGPFFFLILVVYALTLAYMGVLRFAGYRRWFVDLQIANDVLLVSAFVLVTGGLSSYLSPLYVLPIIAGSTLQSMRGGVIAAIFSMIAYGVLVGLQHSEYAALLIQAGVRGLRPHPPEVAWYTVGLNIFGFFAVAVLSGSLAEGRRQADERFALASSEIANLQAFNQHVIDSLVSGLATTDYEGRILTFNRAAAEITGVSREAAVGARAREVLQFPQEFAERLRPNLEGARSQRADFLYTTVEGRAIELGLSATHLLTAGQPAGFLFTFQDVTDARRMERDSRLKQRLAAVGEMAAGLAHEIRNPLASMSGSIQILRQELPLTEDQAQLMDIVLRESERLNRTIRNFLAYARPQHFALAPLDVNRIVSDTAVLLRNSAELGPLHVIDTEPRAKTTCEADEGQLHQILWNLATNGLRAMPDGGRLTLGATTQPDGAVVLFVKDEGVGMTPEELDSIFQPFKGGFVGGTGLGLAIVHRIVSDHCGEVQVSSQPGVGTVVRVRLPPRAKTPPPTAQAWSTGTS